MAAQLFASTSIADSTLPPPLTPALSAVALATDPSSDLAAARAIAQSVCHPVTHVCRRNLTFAELSLLLGEDTPQYISRLPAMQQHYHRAQDAMRAEYRSVSDHIREHKFGANCSINSEGKKQCEFAKAASAADETSYVFPNDFPYALEPPLSHSVIWTRRALGATSSPDVLRLVEHHFPAARFETRHLVNPPSLQSVRELYHIHVFHRPRNATADGTGAG